MAATRPPVHTGPNQVAAHGASPETSGLAPLAARATPPQHTRLHQHEGIPLVPPTELPVGNRVPPRAQPKQRMVSSNRQLHRYRHPATLGHAAVPVPNPFEDSRHDFDSGTTRRSGFAFKPEHRSLRAPTPTHRHHQGVHNRPCTRTCNPGAAYTPHLAPIGCDTPTKRSSPVPSSLEFPTPPRRRQPDDRHTDGPPLDNRANQHGLSPRNSCKHCLQSNPCRHHDTHTALDPLASLAWTKTQYTGTMANHLQNPNRQYLERVKIAGFKSIRNASIELRPDINILIGANGSGKSNFIETFDFVRMLFTQQLTRYVTDKGGADSILHFGRDTTQSMRILLEYFVGSNTDATRAYEVRLHPNDQDQLVITNELAHYHERAKYEKSYDPTGRNKSV